MLFPTAYHQIQNRLSEFNPEGYAGTRNFTYGSVSGLSPYLSRGVITSKDAYTALLNNYGRNQCIPFLKQLLWREYFQRKLQHNPEPASSPLHDTAKAGLPEALLTASTTIEAVDNGIRTLYETGYIHNHLRLYTASICFMAGYSPALPAQWMYYHLLDGDWASNHFSWQWVGGALTGKRYIANQENINFFTGTHQTGSFLDKSYEQLTELRHVEVLLKQAEIEFTSVLPQTAMPVLEGGRPVLLYNNYNLDPLWHSEGDYHKVLLLDPSHYERHPVSSNVLNFTLELAKNITGIQIYAGGFTELVLEYPDARFLAKEHPLFSYPGAIVEPREWLAPHVTRDYPSFSQYFKAVTKKYPEYAAA